jgi:hypothetical protein
MSNISVLGDRLLQFLLGSFPEYAEGFLPGISTDQTRSSLAKLAHALPNDFYELYKWRNGSPEYFPQPFFSGDICQFNPIEAILADMKWEEYANAVPTYKGHPSLPFITINSEFVVIVLGRSYSEDAHIAFVDEVGESYLYCDSIVSMLESTVECFSTGAVTINSSGYVEEDQGLSSEIWRNQNPRSLTEAMSDLRLALELVTLHIHGIEEGREASEYSSVISSLIAALRTLRRFRPSDAIDMVQDALAMLQKVSSEETQGLEFTLARWMEETNS